MGADPNSIGGIALEGIEELAQREQVLVRRRPVPQMQNAQLSSANRVPVDVRVSKTEGVEGGE